MDIWDNNNEKSISSDWHEVYSTTYMEVIALSGTDDDSHREATDKAYERACMKVMMKYNISIDVLDRILNEYSHLFKQKSAKNK